MALIKRTYIRGIKSMGTFLLFLSKIFGFFSQSAAIVSVSFLALSAALKLRRSMRLIGLCALSFIYAAPAWSQDAPHAGPFLIYSKINDNDLVLDQNRVNNEASVHAKNGGDNQLFYIQPLENGYVKIISAYNPELCLDVDQANKNAIFWSCHDGKNQQFQLHLSSDDYTFTIIPRSNPDGCLDVYERTKNVGIWGCHGGDNQRFILERAIRNSNGRHLQESNMFKEFEKALINEIKEGAEGAEALAFISVLSIEKIAEWSKLRQAYYAGDKQEFIDTLSCPGFISKHMYGSECWQNPTLKHTLYKLADYLFQNHHHSQAKSDPNVAHSAPRVKTAVLVDPARKSVQGYLKLEFGDARGNNQSADIVRGIKNKYVNMSRGFDNNRNEKLTKMESRFCPAEPESFKASSLLLHADGISILFSEIQGHKGKLYPTAVKIDQHLYLYKYDKNGKTIGVQTNHGIGFSDSNDLCHLQLAQAVYHQDMTMLELRGEDHQSIFWDKKDSAFVYFYDPRHIDSRYTLPIPVNEGEKGKFNQLLDLASTSHQPITIPLSLDQWVKIKIEETKVDIKQQVVSNNSKAIKKKLPVGKDNIGSGSKKSQDFSVMLLNQILKNRDDHESYCRMTSHDTVNFNLPPAKDSEMLFVEQHKDLGRKVGCFTIEVAGATELQQEGNGYQYDIPAEILALRNIQDQDGDASDDDVDQPQPRVLAIDCNADNPNVNVAQVHDDNYQCDIGANRQKITIFIVTTENNRDIEFNEFFDEDDNVVGFSDLPPWGSQGVMPYDDNDVAAYRVISHGSMFMNASNLEYVQMYVTDSESFQAMFSDATSFTGDFPDSNIAAWDTRNVTNTSSMFAGAYLFNGAIRDWDVSSVTNMNSMFSNAQAFNQNIGDWNTANVRNMSLMFRDAQSFNADIRDWNTANVTDMGWMFQYARRFNQDIGDWNTSRVTDMSHMFQNAGRFNQDIGRWNTANVTQMVRMFYGASSFQQNIVDWNVNNVTHCGGFAEGSGLQTNGGYYRRRLIPFRPGFFRDECR
jgi:surface protein